MNITSLPKDMRNLAKLAVEQGWQVDQLPGSNHIRFRPPEELGGEDIVVSHTVSDHRAITTMKVQLKRAGLLDRADFKKLERQKRKIESLITNKYNVETMRATGTLDLAARGVLRTVGGVTGPQLPTLVDGGTPTDDYAAILASATDKQLEALGLWMAENEVLNGGEPITDCPCGWKATKNVMDTAMHRYTCDRKPKNQPKETKPDPSMRLDCTECDFWCWISQPHMLAEHLHSKHGITACPHCKKKMLTTSLDRHVSQDCPTVKAQAEERRIAAAKEATEARLAERFPLIAEREADHGMTEREAMAAIVAPPPEQDPAPVAAEPVVAVPSLPTPIVEHAVKQIRESQQEKSDDDLFALLEMVLDGPVMLNQKSLTAVNDWMDATRRLLAIKANQ